MSGMSGGMSGEGIGPSLSANSEFSCETLSFSTLVSSPIEDVLNLIEVGCILDVNAASPAGPIDVYYKNNRLGSITSSEEFKLLRCMNEGTKYSATVLNIDGAICKIKIYAVK